MSSSVLVVTVVHHPADARVYHREITALLAAGWRVTYAAPFTGHHRAQPTPGARLRTLDLPRAHGRHRTAALRAARALLAREGERHAVVLLHDPELLVAAAGLGLRNLVWDVHEDTAASLGAKTWLPPGGRLLGRVAVRGVEQWADRRMPLLLAEYAYQDRFDHPHDVVPNATWVPVHVDGPGTDRVVYLGTVTMARGAALLGEVGRLLRRRAGDAVRLEVVGPTADRASATLLGRARERGDLSWDGFVENTEALPRLRGALAGLSLLHDLPNYRHSMPTKVLEYMAYGVPVVTTPLPVPAEVVRSAGCGVVVPFGDPEAVVDEVLALRADPARAARMGAAGHDRVLACYDWRTLSRDFVATMERFARGAPAPLASPA